MLGKWLLTCVSKLPSHPLQAYFRQGVALQYLGRHADALAAFASGLAQDPKSLQLLVGMVEAAMKSPLRGKPTFPVSNVCCGACAASLLLASAAGRKSHLLVRVAAPQCIVGCAPWLLLSSHN